MLGAGPGRAGPGGSEARSLRLHPSLLRPRSSAGSVVGALPPWLQRIDQARPGRAGPGRAGRESRAVEGTYSLLQQLLLLLLLRYSCLSSRVCTRRAAQSAQGSFSASSITLVLLLLGIQHLTTAPPRPATASC